MNLFDKDRDIVHRLVNLVLVLWMAGALFYVFSSKVNLFIKEPTYTFEEYKLSGCNNLVKDLDEVNPIYTEEQSCEVSYQQYLSNIKDNDYRYLKDLIIASGNFFIVGAYVFILNKKTSK